MAKRIEKIDIESGDIFKGIKDSAKSAESEVQVLAETLKIVTEQINTIKTSAKNVKINVNPTNFKDIQEQNKAEKEAIRLANERAKLETTQFRLATMKAKEQERLAKQQERQNKAQTAENSAYAQASKRLNELRKSYKDLAIQGRENESASKAMKKEIIELDATLKRVDGSVGQYQRNVGNYTSAFSKLSGVLGSLGIGLGVGAGLKSAFDTIKNFDEANADMAKTLGISTQEASKLSMEFTKLGSVTSIQGLQEIATIGGQFGISASDIGGFVSSMDKLNVALGSDFGGVEETAKQLGALRNIFTDIKTDNIDQDLLGIGNALNELSSKGAKVEIVSDFANRISGLAIPLGVTSGEVLGLSATLAKLNVNAERGGTAVGTIFQRMTQDAEGFAKVAGVSTEEFTNLLNTDMIGAFKLVAKSFDGMKGDNVLMSKTLESLKLTGSGASEVFLKMASNTELLDSNIKLSTESLKEQDSILQEVEKKSSTVGASVAKLGNAWDAWILEVNDGTGAQNGIISFFDFLSKNLPTIISTVGKLAIGFATFKTVTAVANTDFKALISNFTKFKVEADDAGGKMSGFGNALKGVGWTVAIGLAMELGIELYKIVSGAKEAEMALESYNKKIEEGQKIGSKIQESLSKNLKTRENDIRLQLADGKISEDVARRKMKAIREVQNEQIRAQKIRITALRDEQMEEIKALEEQKKNTSKFLSPIEYGLLTGEIITRRGEVKKMNEVLKSLNDTQEENKEIIFETNIQEKEQAKAKSSSAKATKELTENQKALNKIQEDYLKSIRRLERDEYTPPSVVFADIDAMEQEIIQRRQNVARIKVLEAEKNGDLQKINEARIAEIRENLAIELEDVEKTEVEKLRLKMEAEAQINEIEKEALNKRRAERRKFTDDILSEMDKLSKEEEAKIDERIKAEQELQSNLQAQANAGNISAQQSIEASKEAERKATLEKQKEQQKQQRIEDVKTLLNLINQNIDNDDPVPVATTKAITSLGLIKAIAKGLSGFATGTEWRLGDEHKAQMGGVDGHIVRVDSSEAIIKGSLMDKAESVGIGSTDELVKLAVMQKMNDGTNGFQPSVQVGYKIDTTKIEKRLESLENTIKNKPEVSFDPYIINGIAKGVVHTQRKGNFTRKDLYKS